MSACFVSSPDTSSYAQRRTELLSACAAGLCRNPVKAIYDEVACAAAGLRPARSELIDEALRFVEERRDCADFVLHGVLRMLLRLQGNPLVDPALLRRAEDVVLGFRYWPDEPGEDSMCSWTENHQILFASAAYIAGQLYPDRLFRASGRTGAEQVERFAPRIERWLRLRWLTGFSEWLSNVYADEDATALLSLVDFAGDPSLSQRARIVLDLLFLDMALNSFHGVYGGTHGRSYADEKRFAQRESTTDTSRLLFGLGAFSRSDNMTGPCLAMSSYRLPRAIAEVARDTTLDYQSRQRMGIRIREAGRWGIGLRSLEDGMVLLSLEAYTHPLTIELFSRMLDEWGWWSNSFFAPFASKRRLIEAARRASLLPLVARVFQRDIARNMREEVNIVTFRTPDYMLSTAVDWRPGSGGDQQHIWQATLGPDAVVFTTHPGSLREDSPGLWTGSGVLPRAAQEKNTLVAIYRVSPGPSLYKASSLDFTHAWFPRDCFDEVASAGQWTCARKGDGYVALYSRNPTRWQEQGPDAGRELIAAGRENVWICHMGRRAVDGDFPRFVQGIREARIEHQGARVRFRAPGTGSVELGWRGPFTVNGASIPLSDFPRYDSPFVTASFPPRRIDVSASGDSLQLDFDAGTREAGRYIE